MKYQRILSTIFDRPLLIMQEKGDAICQVVAARAHGVAGTKEEIQAAVGAKRSGDSRVESGSLAVIPVYGTIMHRPDFFSEFSGGTAITNLRTAFRQALNDPNVTGILFEFDSPGGGVDGLIEFADEIARAKGRKPMMGLTNTLSASASYWLMSQLDDIASTPSGLTGSVGCYLCHADFSSYNEKEGVKITYVHYGKNKVEGNSDHPLSEETRAYWQAQVDAVGRQFDAAVARGRKMSTKAVRDTFGGGRVFMSDEAVSINMVDRTATIDEMIDRLASKVKRNSRVGASMARTHTELQAQADRDAIEVARA